jgi:septal ring factor EnvC (AmiA/AmiB activator)
MERDIMDHCWRNAMDHERDKNGAGEIGSLADELRRESDRLRQLAEELKAREESQAEMRENYPHFKQALYASLREKFMSELPPPSRRGPGSIRNRRGCSTA